MFSSPERNTIQMASVHSNKCTNKHQISAPDVSTKRQPAPNGITKYQHQMLSPNVNVEFLNQMSAQHVSSKCKH